MATYETPQPVWKRNLAGILDFFFVVYPLALLLSKMPGNPPPRPFVTQSGIAMLELRLTGTYALVLLALTIAYFVIANRTGGTIFQRLFRMRPVK